ncbi:hypothetical protein [Mycolicibacterium sediminis]|uniref:Uncharacterized protein n=1 Tax=Mycolicibacterium sediminis TaxID=1286180 RepID=A0A7I7QN25_9MYCO|nr:hypothetical protein [Mycolicibacterium sediminis]BBY27704.1 hypothetical protein MSEDJ_18000 [Mycolicibacterium sediminis]
MTGGRGDEPDDPREPAWHERTSTLLGASVGAVAVLGVLYLLISSLLTGSDDPDPAGQYFLEPTATTSRFSTSGSESTTTTQTITSTSPPATTDINDPNAPTSTTSGTETTDSDFGDTPTSRSSRSTTGEDGPTSRRPRFNETRTLYPRP